LKHWDQLTTRMRSSAKQATTAAEWVSLMMRKLQIESPSLGCSHSVESLVIRAHGHEPQWLDLIEREVGYLIASARVEAEARQVAKNA
jgi:hypothetical protein